MVVVCVRGPIRKLACDRGEHEFEGSTVIECFARWNSAIRR